MEATLILADYATVADGKLIVVGGGWNVIGPVVGPTAVAIMAEVPLDDARDVHTFALRLRATTAAADDEPLVMVEGSFEVVHSPGTPPGTPLMFVAGNAIPPLPLQPGQMHVWELHVDGSELPVSQRAFWVRNETGRAP